MSDLIASNIAVAFGPRPLFEDVSVTVGRGDRVALVGPNGAGKTTLLRVLSGQLTPSGGTLRSPDHIHVSLHDQRPERQPIPLIDYVAPARMVELEAQLRSLELEMASGDPDVMNRYDDVRTRYDAMGGEGWHVLVDTVMRGLGFEDRQLNQNLDTFSGGELTRASLARALAGAPDVLLLDEPTNHLDMESIDWLQEHLESMPGGVVVVSHDRWFIESVCTSVLEVVAGRARRFQGSFVEYRAQQALEAVTHQKHVEKWKTEIARVQRFVDKFSAGTRSKQAQSRVKVMERLRQDAPQYADLRQRKGLDFRMPNPASSGRTVFDVRGMELGFDGGDGHEPRTLLERSDLVVEKGEKIALLGRNGSGKSTLMHALAAACVPHSEQPEGYRTGEVRVGYNVQPRLLSQHDSELVDTHSLLGNMQLAAPGLGRTDAMNLLGLFALAGDQAEQLVSTLSGGERRRLLMAMSLAGGANVLLLDEPTNHLDIESREALEAALTDYQGTVLLISHDRALVEGVATRTVVLHERTLHTVNGGFEAARELLSGSGASAQPQANAARGERASGGSPRSSSGGQGATTSSKHPTGGVKTGGSAGPTAAGSSGTSAGGGAVGGARTVKRRDGSSSARGGRPKGAKVRRPATIEQEIATLELRFGEVQTSMLDPEVYTSGEKSTAALAEHSQLERDIARRYEELEASLEHHGG